MKKITIIESKNEIMRYIFSLHLAKILSKKKMNVLILDTNQINSFLDFPKILCSLKIIKSEEPYKLKINTITNRTDILKLPNDLFAESINDNSIIKNFKILIKYLLEKYDYIICTSFITNNPIIQMLLEYSSFVINIDTIDEVNEETIIEKSKNLFNNNVEYKLILKNFDKSDVLNIKKFLNLKKIFEDSLINEQIFFKEYNFNISFISPKIYDKNTEKNIIKILDDINFYKTKI